VKIEKEEYGSSHLENCTSEDQSFERYQAITTCIILSSHACLEYCTGKFGNNPVKC